MNMAAEAEKSKEVAPEKQRRRSEGVPFTENRLRQMIKTALGAGWDIQRHEDKLSIGIPDVSYAGDGVDGWIELKVCKSGPWLKGLTNVQKGWIRRRGKTGSGRVFVAVWVKTKDEDLLAIYRWDDIGRFAPKHAPTILDLRAEHIQLGTRLRAVFAR